MIPNSLGVHEHCWFDAHLGGELQGCALGIPIVWEGKGEGGLHHAVAGGVAVGADEGVRGARVGQALANVLHAALGLVLGAVHRVLPSASIVMAGLS